MKNREIKFRLWDGNEIVNGPNSWVLTYASAHSVTAEQFTGIHDVKGREVYEGDVVSARMELANYSFIPKEGPVSFSLGMFVLDGHPLADYEELEVVGNIHEDDYFEDRKLTKRTK